MVVVRASHRADFFEMEGGEGGARRRPCGLDDISRLHHGGPNGRRSRISCQKRARSCIVTWKFLVCVLSSNVCVGSIHSVRTAGNSLVGRGYRLSSSLRSRHLVPDQLGLSINKDLNVGGLKEKDRVVLAAAKCMDSKDIMEEIACSAEESSSDWSEHFGQRYSDIMPPMPHNKQSTLQKSLSLSVDERCHKHLMSDCDYVLLLDLDKCSFFGNDINDLGICLQWMGRPQEEVVQLYSMLMSPCVRQAYDALRSRYSRLKVVIYTARATLVNYRSAFRENKVIPVSWNPKFLANDGQVYFPPHMAKAGDIMQASATGLEEDMIQDERDDLHKALERLLAARQNIKQALALDSLPDLVVTATAKDVEGTVGRLGFRPAHGAVLWDDNERLRGAAGVVTVPAFVRLPPAQRAAVLSFLEERLPAATLEPDLVEFMLGAGPDDCALTRRPDGGLEYRLPAADDAGAAGCGAHEPWPLPAVQQSTVPLPAAVADGGAGCVSWGPGREAGDEWDECASSVTPENEAMRVTSLPRAVAPLLHAR